MSEENTNIRTSIEASVMPVTAQALDKLAHDADLSVGEVIDRLTLRMTAHEIQWAVQLASEEVMMCLSGLSHEDFKEAFDQLMVDLAMALPEDKLSSLAQRAKAKREETMENISNLSPEDLASLKALLEQQAAAAEGKKPQP